MSLILHIDTSLETAFVSIAKDAVPVVIKTNTVQKEHAGFVHKAVEEVIHECGMRLSDLAAIAVTEGPGSYTGLRVGMSSAIGLCYALKKPFIKISTLKMIAQDAYLQAQDTDALYCPMVDARRMEVFTAMYDHELNVILKPMAMILEDDSFKDSLEKHRIYFSGNGSSKFKNILSEKNAVFLSSNNLPLSLSQLSYAAFLSSSFSNFTDSEPNYIKEYVNFGSK